MTRPLPNPRALEADADPQFPDRWSPRSFADEPLSDDQVRALFEAARWSPSSYNDQPWLFLYARSAADRERFGSALVEQNRAWAARAPLLVFAAARRRFRRDGRPNRHAAFDTGAAWMALALQARKLGLHAHAMAGFDERRAREVLGLDPEEHEVLAAIAVGRRADPGRLPEDLRGAETPSPRRGLSEVAREASRAGDADG